MICGYEMLSSKIDILKDISYETVIFDEMHRLKNPKTICTRTCRSITCRRKIGLTGTLMQNDHDELYCLMETIIPGIVGFKIS